MIRGRPRINISPERRELIERTLRKRGRAATALVLGESVRVVRSVAEELMLRTRRREEPSWTPIEDEHLFEHQNDARAELIAALEELSGVTRTDEQIRRRLRELQQRAMRGLRLSLAQVAELLGRSEEFVVEEGRRKRLRVCRDHESGRPYVFPSDLRRYVDEGGFDLVDWVKAARFQLVELLRGRWGVSDEQRRSPERRARKTRRP